MQTIYFLKAHHAGNQYRPVLTQYHRVPTSTALYWPSIQWFDGLDHVNQIFSVSTSHWQPVPLCFDPVSPNTDQYHPILTQYHQVTTSTALYRPSTINSHKGSSLTRATCHFLFFIGWDQFLLLELLERDQWKNTLYDWVWVTGEWVTDRQGNDNAKGNGNGLFPKRNIHIESNSFCHLQNPKTHK